MASLNTEWHYITAGDDETQSILFLHGFMGSCSEWRSTFDQLSGDFYCIAPDLPGHGKTKANVDNLSFESLTEDIVKLIDGLKSKPILYGYSMGGRVALYIALKHPNLFPALVLESTTAGLENEDERKSRLGIDFERAGKFQKSSMKEFLIEWYKMPTFSYLQNRPDLIERLVNKKTSNDPKALARIITKLSPGAQPQLWDKLPQWQKPMLIITGEKDTNFCKASRRMAKILPHAELCVIPEAGHIVHLEKHKDFMSALNSFLASYIL